jgi:hypothetical protein
MRRLVIVVAAVLFNSHASAQPEADRPRRLLRSDYYTVTWGSPAAIKADAELEVGEGGGHSGTLAWVRVRPGDRRVDVLRVELDPRERTDPKDQPGRAPVLVRRAEMKPDEYALLLRDLAVVAAARLKEADDISGGFGTADFWVQARLTAGPVVHLDEDWAGYPTKREAEFAKPQAAVVLAREAMAKLDFKDHALTPEEQGWASAKFARDWKRFKGKEYHWWVRERYIYVIGAVGDKAALPVLRDILTAELPKDRRAGESEYRCATSAVTAAERLTKAKLWGREGEDGDLEAARRKALDLLRDNK